MDEATQGPKMPCPICGESIDARARKCRFCNEWLTQYPVVFETGRERILGTSYADIRTGAGSIRVSPEGLRFEGTVAATFALVSAALEGSQGVVEHATDEVERVVHETNKRRLLICVRRRGARLSQCYQCLSDQMPELLAALREVLPPERIIERASYENGKMMQDRALICAFFAMLLPIPLIGCVIVVLALVFGVMAIERAKSVGASVVLFLALASAAENGWINYLVFRH